MKRTTKKRFKWLLSDKPRKLKKQINLSYKEMIESIEYLKTKENSTYYKP